MCVVSMIMERGLEDWPWEHPTITTTNPNLLGNQWTFVDVAAKETNEKLARLLEQLLEKAHDYDKKTGQPECPDAEKKVKLLKLANELGVRIHFPDEAEEGSDPSECRQN